MESKDKEYLRDLIAMFAMNGLLQIPGEYNDQALAELSYSLADTMIKAREKNEKDADGGITTIVPKRKRSRSNS
jgi:hypothetical protein